MALNAQQKRVSKNRVSITFDVEDGGAVQQKELDFVTGMIGGYSGDRTDKEQLEDRTFLFTLWLPTAFPGQSSLCCRTPSPR